MIVIDTSALMALLLSEPTADEIAGILAGEDKLVISAGTLAEALIVAARRGIAEEMDMLLNGIGIEVDSVTAASAVGIAQAYDKWGRGVHPAGLNFGDCFAYQSAKTRGASLLFVGEDFSRTDVVPAIHTTD